jgi:hypothetical protein
LWIAGGVAFLLASLYFLRRRHSLAATLVLGAFFLTGALHMQLRGSTNLLDTTLQPFADGQQVEMTAHVTREGRFRDGGPSEVRQTLDVQTEEIVTEDGAKTPVHSGVRLGIYSPYPPATELSREAPTLSARLFHYGERIRLSVKLKLPRNFHNPGAFDYEGYLAGNGIAALGSAKPADVESLPGFSGTRL